MFEFFTYFHLFLFGQFNDGVRLSFQLTSMLGHLVCKQVNIGFEMATDLKSLSSMIAEPLLYFTCN